MPDFCFEPFSSFDYTKLPDKSPLWVTHTKAWANVLEKTYPHIKGYLVSDDKTPGSKSIFLPIFQVKRPLRGTHWLSIPYATISDPILGNEENARHLFEAIRNNPLTHNCSVEIRSSREIANIPLFNVCNGSLNHQITLDGDENEIFKRFHRTAVQVHIRKSLASGLVFKLGTTIHDVATFYKIYIRMRRELSLPPQPYCFFSNMWNELYSTNNVEVLMAEFNGKVVAAMWVLKNNWLYSFEYLARACKNDKMHSSHFLYWHGIKRALENKIGNVSFGRTSAGNKGLDEFKRRWGTVVTPYYDFIYPKSEIVGNENTRYYNLMKKYSKMLPLPLFRLTGEIIFRLI